MSNTAVPDNVKNENNKQCSQSETNASRKVEKPSPTMPFIVAGCMCRVTLDEIESLYESALEG